MSINKIVNFLRVLSRLSLVENNINTYIVIRKIAIKSNRASKTSIRTVSILNYDAFTVTNSIYIPGYVFKKLLYNSN